MVRIVSLQVPVKVPAGETPVLATRSPFALTRPPPARTGVVPTGTASTRTTSWRTDTFGTGQVGRGHLVGDGVTGSDGGCRRDGVDLDDVGRRFDDAQGRGVGRSGSVGLPPRRPRTRRRRCLSRVVPATPARRPARRTMIVDGVRRRRRLHRGSRRAGCSGRGRRTPTAGVVSVPPSRRSPSPSMAAGCHRSAPGSGSIRRTARCRRSTRRPVGSVSDERAVRRRACRRGWSGVSSYCTISPIVARSSAAPGCRSSRCRPRSMPEACAFATEGAAVYRNA